MKYLLPIIAAGAIASVSYAAPIALELWEFEDAAGLSFPTEANPNGFANSGSNDSLWNISGFGGGASTDGNGNLVVTGKTGVVSRETVPYSSPLTTGKYRLTLNISSWNMSAGLLNFFVFGGPTGDTSVAGLKLERSDANGTRLSAIIRSSSSPYGGNRYIAYNLPDSSTTPISAYIEFDLDNDSAEFVVDGNVLGSAVTDLDSIDLTTLKVLQNANFVGTNEVKIASMGLYAISNLTFTLNAEGTEYSVTDCESNASGSLEIPSTFNALPVTSIGDSAFSNCSGLSSITIPNSVTSIGEYAFSDCSSLTSIIIPGSVTSIGDQAFEYCSSLSSVTIEDGVTSIGEYAFLDCSSLTSIIIPGSVTSIGEDAFSGCTSLSSVTIEDGVTSIGEYAFQNCTSLTSITIPDSVTSIEETAFEGCDNLTSITLPYNLAYIISQDAVPTYTFDAIVDALKDNPDFIGAVAQAMLAAENNSGFATKEELPLIEQAGIEAGIDQVMAYPADYDLATPAEVASSRTDGQQDVIGSPSDYGLMGAEGVFDMRVSQPGISTNGDMASMNFTIQSSNDLEEWNNEETIRRRYTMPSDKNFMRVSVGPQLEPEPLVTIATDTYGDKLVYDDSNNLYVNDENTPLMRDGVNLRTDTYSGWNFYAIEPVGNRYLCILKNGNRNVIMFFELDGNYLYNTNIIYDLSAYESDFGQSLD